MAVATAVAWAFNRLGLSDADLVMSFLLGVVYVAARLGRSPAIYASTVAVLLFNFLSPSINNGNPWKKWWALRSSGYLAN